MTDYTNATRRSFLKRGALVAAPLAATSVCAVALADDAAQRRLARLEAEAAIRTAHQSWLRQFNAAGAGLGSVHRITAHHAGIPDRLAVAADGTSAVGHYDCAVEFQALLPQDSTLSQMAHAQGHGTVHQTQRRMLTVEYSRSAAGWSIGRITLA
jgi:hypothetical protein